ncbi:MAG TPA: hypothetical protein VNN99_08685 [Vicinamibacterales bacterium]|jgi:hypothetical protein|nr:hypothetical protein [Vicinamibacterales bacterium]
MRFRTTVASTLLATAAAVTLHAHVSAAPPAAAGAASRQQAESLARKITQITQRGATTPAPVARRTEVTEDEVNSWFVFRGRQYLPAGLSDPSVSMLGAGTMRGVATVDLEALGKRKSRGGGMLDLWSYLGGKVPIAVTGTLRAQDGRGRFEMQSAEVAGLPVPKALVQELVSAYTADDAGVSLDSSFDLPAKIRSIDVGRGQLVVVQ